MPKVFEVERLAINAKWVHQDYLAWSSSRSDTDLDNLKLSVRQLLEYVSEEVLLPSATYLVDRL